MGIALPPSRYYHLGDKVVGWPGHNPTVRHPRLGSFSAFQGTHRPLVPGRGVGVCFPDTGSDLYAAGDQRYPGCHWLEAPVVGGAALDPAGWFLRPAGTLYLDVCARHVGRDALPGRHTPRRQEGNQTNVGICHPGRTGWPCGRDRHPTPAGEQAAYGGSPGSARDATQGRMSSARPGCCKC